jgi:hypothetical protein
MYSIGSSAGQQRLGGVWLAPEHQEAHVLFMRMVRLVEQRKYHVTNHEPEQPSVGGRRTT